MTTYREKIEVGYMKGREEGEWDDIEWNTYYMYMTI